MTQPLVDETSRRYPGWRVVFACFVMALFCWGFGFYGHGVYLAEMQRLHGWPASLVSAASTAYYLVSAILVVYVNDMLRRLGARAVVLVGMACFALSLAMLAVLSEIWQLFAAYLVMSLAWAAMSLGAITNIVGLWFDARRGLAISLALQGASLGGIVIVPAIVLATGEIGFSGALFSAIAVMAMVMLPVVWLCLPPPPPKVHPVGMKAGGTWTRDRALRSPLFWTATAPFALGLLQQAGVLVHQISFLDPLVGRTTAGFTVAATTIASVTGRLILGAYVDRLDQRLTTALCLASQAIALVAMTQTTDAAWLIGACVIYGFSVGNLITLPALIVQREFDAASFGLLIGLSTGICQFAYAFGPGLIGAVRDWTGSYGASWALCAVLNALAAVIVMIRLKRA